MSLFFVRFLHDILSVLIRDHSIFQGLYTDEEMVSDNVKGVKLITRFSLDLVAD